jgi:hypothetical protein
MMHEAALAERLPLKGLTTGNGFSVVRAFRPVFMPNFSHSCSFDSFWHIL